MTVFVLLAQLQGLLVVNQGPVVLCNQIVSVEQACCPQPVTSTCSTSQTAAAVVHNMALAGKPMQETLLLRR